MKTLVPNEYRNKPLESNVLLLFWRKRLSCEDVSFQNLPYLVDQRCETELFIIDVCWNEVKGFIKSVL